MLGFLSNLQKSYTTENPQLLIELQEEYSRTDIYYKQLQNWKNIEYDYVHKMEQLASNIRNKAVNANSKEQAQCLVGRPERWRHLCGQLSTIMQVLAANHNSFLAKISNDILVESLEKYKKYRPQSKKLLDQQKAIQKQISNKRQQLQKSIVKRLKARKQRQQQQILHIFMQDSVDITIDKKIRKKNKINQLVNQLQLYDIKVRQNRQDFLRSQEREKVVLQKLAVNYESLLECQYKTLEEFSTYWSQYCLNMSTCFTSFTGQLSKHPSKIPSEIESIFTRKQDEIFIRSQKQDQGFISKSLKLINNNQIEELTDYASKKGEQDSHSQSNRERGDISRADR